MTDGVGQYDARRANPESVPKLTATNFDIKFRDFMVLIASVNGGAAHRNTMIPLFTKNLSQSTATEDLYEVFLKTHRGIITTASEQVPEFRSTLTHKLCLRKVFNPKKFKESPSTLDSIARFFK